MIYLGSESTCKYHNCDSLIQQNLILANDSDIHWTHASNSKEDTWQNLKGYKI